MKGANLLDESSVTLQDEGGRDRAADEVRP